MAGVPDISGGQAAAGATASAALTEATVGLEKAWQKAGDVLSGIFGGRPWEMSWQSIVDAVGGQGADAAGMLVPSLVEVVGVVL